MAKYLKKIKGLPIGLVVMLVVMALVASGIAYTYYVQIGADGNVTISSGWEISEDGDPSEAVGDYDIDFSYIGFPGGSDWVEFDLSYLGGDVTTLDFLVTDDQSNGITAWVALRSSPETPITDITVATPGTPENFELVFKLTVDALASPGVHTAYCFIEPA